VGQVAIATPASVTVVHDRAQPPAGAGVHGTGSEHAVVAVSVPQVSSEIVTKAVIQRELASDY
jgi:hypothetical protein